MRMSPSYGPAISTSTAAPCPVVQCHVQSVSREDQTPEELTQRLQVGLQ